MKSAEIPHARYTTKLDMSNVGKSQADAAAKLAAEIEGAAGDSVHAAEERGQKVDLKGLTEEDLYRCEDTRAHVSTYTFAQANDTHMDVCRVPHNKGEAMAENASQTRATAVYFSNCLNKCSNQLFVVFC